jgi:hypothetical protein
VLVCIMIYPLLPFSPPEENCLSDCTPPEPPTTIAPFVFGVPISN